MERINHKGVLKMIFRKFKMHIGIKKIKYNTLFLLIIFVSINVFLSGCAEEVHQDQRMNNGVQKENEIEYLIYNTALIDSGYNWYSEFLGEYILSLKNNDYQVSKKSVEEQLNKLNIKYEEVSNIDIEKVKLTMEYNKKELSKKEIEDDAYFEQVKNNESNIKGNIYNMKDILSFIRKGLELGIDGKYDENDLKEIYDIQKKTIDIYTNQIKLQSY